MNTGIAHGKRSVAVVRATALRRCFVEYIIYLETPCLSGLFVALIDSLLFFLFFPSGVFHHASHTFLIMSADLYRRKYASWVATVKMLM